MAELRVSTITAEQTVLSDSDVGKLRAGVRGGVLCPGDDGYDDARKLWNGMIDKRPALIVCCAGAGDVVSAVNFARDHNLLTSVRGGGHSAAGNAIAEGGLMIDLSAMRSIRVNPGKQTARAEGGVKWGEFDQETQAFGLATTGGTNSDTGIGGLTLGGGIGWLSGKHGLACDNLLSVDIVTADGRLLIASQDENPDLFWAVRGGGGNFGVVTSFEYQLHPVGPTLQAGMVMHPFDKTKEVLKFYREFSGNIPDEMNTVGALLTSPEGQKVAAMAACYNGPLQEGEEALRPLKEFGPPVADHIQPMPYLALQTMLDPAAPPGRQYYWKGALIETISDELIDTLINQFAAVPSPFSVLVLQQLGNATNRVPTDATAFSHRHPRYDCVIISGWEDPSEAEKNIQWTRQVYEAIRLFSSGGIYVNALGFTEDVVEGRVKDAYQPATYQRLVALKKKYDPTNLFQLNVNIKPTP